MGISILEETIVAVKLSGGAAKTDKPVNKILAMKKTDTKYLTLALDMISSSYDSNMPFSSLLPKVKDAIQRLNL
jgi:hypothetical protein